jgi:hypothetical protein
MGILILRISASKLKEYGTLSETLLETLLDTFTSFKGAF